MPRRALLIVNRNSSQGEGELQPCLEILRQEGDIEAEVFVSESRDHVAEIVAEHGAGVDMVIMAGGDGTMNAAVDCLHERGLAFAVLPLGTANDLARTLGVPSDTRAACRAIATGHVRRIDLGRVNGKLFFNVASIGAAAHLSQALDRELKARWGVLSYPIRVREVIDADRAFTAEIEDEAGQVTVVRSIQVAVGNGRCYGGGMRVAEDSAIDDQRLDLYSLEPQSLWRLILSLPHIRAGRHRAVDGAIEMSGRRFTVRTDHPMDVSTDGEVTTQTPAVFEVLPLALAVVVPPGHDAEPVGRIMIRDDRAVALDDVIIALKRSVEDLEDAAATLDEGQALARLLSGIAARRRACVVPLEEALRDLGDLPSAPDADRQTFAHLATRLKAALLGNEDATLREAAQADEAALAEAIAGALEADLPETVQATLRRLAEDVAQARDALAENAANGAA